MKIRLLFTLLALTTACTAPRSFKDALTSDETKVNPVIWNEDTREEITKTDANLETAMATAVLFHKHRVNPLGDGTFSVPLNPLRLNYPLCEDEKFRDQDQLGHCSGVLVAPTVLLTAGHCVKQQTFCDDIYISFGRTEEKAKTSSFKKDDLYTCRRIIKSVLTLTKDYAFIELDREVTQAKPVAVGPGSLLTAGEKVLSLSYPLGLPLKKDQAEVLKNDPVDYNIRVKADTFSGSSGSPLFNQKNELVGILISGADDFNEDEGALRKNFIEGTCVKAKRCTDNTCFGERYIKTEAMGFF